MAGKNEFVEYLLDLLADFGPVEARGHVWGVRDLQTEPDVCHRDR